jgi:F0F1-type ATP synthase membrane subunit b/b'
MLQKTKNWIVQGLLLLSAPAMALAAENAADHGAHAPAELSSLWWTTLNFLIFAFIMGRLYKKYGRPALLSRAATFEQHVKKAAQVLDDAERELRDVEERLQAILDEQREIRERLVREGTQVAAQIVAQAEQSALAVRSDVGRRIERELSAATADVREQVIARATEVARRKLASGLSEEDDSRLRQDAVRGLFSTTNS